MGSQRPPYLLWHSKPHGIHMDDVRTNRAIVRLPFQYGKYIVSIKTISKQSGQNSHPCPQATEKYAPALKRPMCRGREQDTAHYGQFKAAAEQQGRSLPALDMLIAARVNGLILLAMMAHLAKLMVWPLKIGLPEKPECRFQVVFVWFRLRAGLPAASNQTPSPAQTVPRARLPFPLLPQTSPAGAPTRRSRHKALDTRPGALPFRCAARCAAVRRACLCSGGRGRGAGGWTWDFLEA